MGSFNFVPTMSLSDFSSTIIVVIATATVQTGTISKPI